MPNSSWTETGAGIDLVPVSTPVTDAEQQSPDYLTNADKILLMAQWAAEENTKTQLDTTAATLGISSTAYDNAVAAVSTNLIAAGAPSNWATIWPDGTTFGPVTDIKTSLGNWWSAVATQRTVLQTEISSQQAANAQAAATAAAATDATNKMNTAISIVAPIVVTSLPTLPDSDYPNGKVVWNAADNKLYKNSSGTWALLSVDATNLVANSITAGQIAVGAIGADQIAAGAITAAALTLTSASLIPDPDFASGSVGWYGFIQRLISTNASVPSGCPGRYAGQFGSRDDQNKSSIQVVPGEKYFVSLYVNPNGGSGGAGIGIVAYEYKADGTVNSSYAVSSTTATGWTEVTGVITPANNTVALSVGPWADYSAFVNGAAGAPWFTGMTLRKMADASLIVDGTITTAKIDAGGISADVIKTGTLDASVVTVTNLDASNITVGTLAASKVQFPDGSALTSSNRTKLTVSSPSSAQPIVSGSYNAVSGMSASVTIASAAEVVLVSLNMSAYYSSGPGDTLFVRLMVDGNIAASFSYAITGISTNPSKYTLPTQSLVLTTGTHTIDVDVNSSGTGDFVDTTAALYTIHIY